MGTRAQILGTSETLSDLAWAADHRFREAEVLLGASHWSGAVYLFGIASEIWLKLACFRLVGNGPGTLVHTQLAPARAWMQRHAPSINPEAYHSLRFWAEYLRRLRVAQGRPLANNLAGPLQHHVVNRLFADWKVDVRYRALLLTEAQAWRVYRDASWVRTVKDRLWR
jgi:hypothetical protein